MKLSSSSVEHFGCDRLGWSWTKLRFLGRAAVGANANLSKLLQSRCMMPKRSAHGDTNPKINGISRTSERSPTNVFASDDNFFTTSTDRISPAPSKNWNCGDEEELAIWETFMSPGLDLRAFRSASERKTNKNMNSYVTISSPRTASCALFARCESTQLSLHLREGQTLFASIIWRRLWSHFELRAR